MADPVFDTSSPVLVTGASGYVAGWLVARLLDEGFTVHATVRDPNDAAKTAHLSALAEGRPGEIRFFAANLLEPGSFAEAMQGCAVVFHTASPFISTFSDPQKDLVDPAVNGTRTVLESASATPSVKRVVVTSSCAAMFGSLDDVANSPGGMLGESSWNETSSLTDGPYRYSKTLAEKAAWEMAEDAAWKLVTVNPALIVGPGLSPKPTSASFDYVRKIGDGSFEDGTKPFEVGMVDVRDVAETHLRAGFVPDAKGRYICFSEVSSLDGLADILREVHGEAYPFPPKKPPMGEPRWKADNGKAKNELGIAFRPIAPGTLEMFEQLKAAGVFG